MKFPKIFSNPYLFSLILIVLTIIIHFLIKPILAEDTDLIIIAKKIKSNLESFTWKRTIGFNYSDSFEMSLPPLSEKDSLLLSLINIHPFMSIPSSEQSLPYDIIDNPTETSINFKKIIINYKFDIKLNFSYENSNITIDIIKTDLFASQNSFDIKFLKDLSTGKFILINYNYSDIILLSNCELFETKIYKENIININNEIKTLLQKSLESYLTQVIFYYPSTDIQKKFYNMVMYLLKKVFVFITKTYYFRSLDFSDITYDIDENFLFNNVICEVIFTKQVNQAYPGLHIFFESIKVNEDGVELGVFTTDFEDKIQVKNKFQQGVKECFDEAFKETNWG